MAHNAPRANGHDLRDWRKAQRSGREKGCWVYIPAEAMGPSLRPSLAERLAESPENLVYQVRPWGKNRVIIAFGDSA